MSKQERDDLLLGILDNMYTVALVGASAKPERPSHQVMKYLLERGVRVVPVNPGLEGQEILGRTVYASLAAIDGHYDVVDIFRAADAALEVVREAIRLMDEKDIQVVWLQQGIVNDQAIQEAEQAGLVAIQDRCIKKDMERLCPA